jgi:hypothetical protein
VTTVAGQAIAGLTEGARIRIRPNDGQKWTGKVEAITADTLVLQPEKRKTAPVSIPVAALTRIEVSRGVSRGRPLRKSVGWGAAIGETSGAVLLEIQHEEVGGGSSAGEAAVLGAVSGAITGGLVGLLIGLFGSSDKWERIR